MLQDVCDGFSRVCWIHRRCGWPGHVRKGTLWVLWLCSALAMHQATASVMTFSARVVTVDQFMTAPVVEIVFPPADHVHAAKEISIQVTLRRELLRKAGHHHLVCVGMATVGVPEDVAFDDVGKPTERCYDALDEPKAAYTVTGLVPGALYSVSVALVDGGDQVVGLSMRSFQVASVTGFTDRDEFVRMGVGDALAMARRLHFKSDRKSAVSIYRKVLEMFPRHVEALHGLGQALYQEGEAEQAVDLLRQALELDVTDASMHVSLALSLKAMGRTDDASRAFRAALELRPSFAHAAFGLGGLLRSMGQWDEAIHAYRKVVATANDPPPDHQVLEPPHKDMVVEAIAWVCEILRLADDLDEAERCLSKATIDFPDQVRFHIDRGHLLVYGGQFDAAQREYETASQLGSVHGATHAADVLETIGEYEVSIRRYKEVLDSPHAKSSTVYNQIAIMLTTVLPRILPASQDAIDLQRTRFRDNVASVLRHLDQNRSVILIDPSRIAFSTAVTMNAHHRNNRELKKLLGQMYYGLWIDPGIVREDYVNSYGITPIPYHQTYHHDPPMPHPRLRIGFVSRFFYQTAVGLFMNELLPQLNATTYEVFAFGIGLSKSVKAYEQVPQIAEHVVALPLDLRLAREEIRAHKMDILIYPELGMDKTTYFMSYHRLAPVQAVWWGNPDTSGVPTIDYYITSEHEHENCRDHYTETVYPMKGLGIYHSLPPQPNSTIMRDDIRQTVQKLFNITRDFRFYLSIESILHFHPDFDEAIRLIFDRDPLAHIFLLASSTRTSWKHHLQRRIEAHMGPAFASRVLFFTDVNARQEILLLGAADAVLAGLHMTRPEAAMQALTAGVPIVTLAGELWATRITAAFYKQMKIRGLTATSLQEYADLAVRLATNEAFRNRMRRKIHRHRERLSRDRTAVAEWERFFEFASSQRRAEDQDAQALEAVETADTNHLSRDQGAQAIAVVEAMTCPATSLLHLL